MLLSYLWDFRYAYIHVKETITVSNTAVAGAIINNVDKKVICKICAPFTDFISEINNTQMHNAKDIDVVIPVHQLIEYSVIYSETSRSLLHYHRHKLDADENYNIVEFTNTTAITNYFKFKEKITDKTENDGT